MSLAILASQALCGTRVRPVRVEVHAASGLPAFHIVGLPDTGVRESRERVRAAIVSSGFAFPSGRVTVNLAPADLPKASGRFDLPIALGILLASGQLSPVKYPGGTALSHHTFAGELSLTGVIMPVTGSLMLALGVAANHPGTTLILPSEGAQLAAHVPQVRIFAATTLAQVAAYLAGQETLASVSPGAFPVASEAESCLSDVRGQDVAKRMLEVAASGRHSMLMVGSPGAGKSMLAQRLRGLLPDLSIREILEVAAIAGLCHDAPLSDGHGAPFRTPHHSVSVPALIGGGAMPRPGEITRAHHGVLFLDELPEFSRPALESLREPLETGEVTIARARGTLVFDASFQLVAAMNPCPCGWHGHPERSCRCTPDQVSRYRNRVSGPFLDRIDLQFRLPSPASGWIHQQPGESSAMVRSRVKQTRQRQYDRQGCLNSALSAAGVGQFCQLNPAASQLLTDGLARWAWSARAVHRTLRVARTVADMAASSTILPEHLAEAIQYRQV